MGPIPETVLAAMQADAFRARANSSGSTCSTSSVESDPGALGLQMSDIKTIANLLGNNPFPVAGIDGAKLTTSRYKTEMCRSFTETGFCKYGEKCQFAHGQHEMKCMPRHPKYKSELCRTFHTTGLCPYGTRCHFIHSEDGAKLTEINLMKQQAAAQQATQQMVQQAARLRAQQQAIQNQMQALMLSQLQLQLAQTQLPQTAVNAATRPVLMPQMSVPVTNLPSTTATLPPRPVERSTSLPATQHQVALPTASLGSVVDTPPVTPPCGSPVFNNTPTKVVSPPPGFAPKDNVERKSTVACNLDTVFNFPPSTTSSVSEFTSSDLNALDIGLCNLDLDSVSLDSGCDLYTPSTSPDSMLQSPLESPKSSRLPVFSQLAGQ